MHMHTIGNIQFGPSTKIDMDNSDSIKAFINRFFSDDLRNDKSIAAGMERHQLEKWLRQWAADGSHDMKRPYYTLPAEPEKKSLLE